MSFSKVFRTFSHHNDFGECPYSSETVLEEVNQQMCPSNILIFYLGNVVPRATRDRIAQTCLSRGGGRKYKINANLIFKSYEIKTSPELFITAGEDAAVVSENDHFL